MPRSQGLGVGEFSAQFWPVRTLFGVGRCWEAATELRRLGFSRVLVLCTPEQRALAASLESSLEGLSAGLYDRAVMHVPVETVDQALEHCLGLRIDGLLALGGGSTIGLAKALALRSELTYLAIPTTYAGSEMTPIWGLTEDGLKRTGRDPRVLPRTVIYDPSLLVSLPAAITGPSGMNAIAHALEGLYAVDRNPITDLMAEEAIRSMAAALPAAVADPGDLEARADTLYAAWLAGAVLGMVGMGLHHKLCHVLGGRFNLAHADTHAIVLPQVAGFNASAAPEALGRAARALGVDSAAAVGSALFRLLGQTCPNLDLAALGLAHEGLEQAADLALQDRYANPRQASRPELLELLERAFYGRAPG